MKYFFILLLSFFSFGAQAADETIEMLNKLDKEIMVFSKKIVRIDVGNKVFWKATDKGHNVEFIKGGTIIFIPFSNVAGLYEEETVCPFKAASVVSILQLIWFGRSIFIGISL